MDLSIRRVAKTSSLSGDVFGDGETVECFLYRGSAGELERADLREGEVEAWEAPGAVLCRWRHRLRPAAKSEAEARRQTLATAEELFLALLEPAPANDAAEDPGAEARAARERAILLHLLALMLERKRVLKPVRGRPQCYLLGPEKRVIEVARVELDPREIAPLVAELEGLL
jgi:hypothetical protein